MSWDVAADGVNSDRVALRLVVTPSGAPTVLDPEQRTSTASSTLLFRGAECFPQDGDGDGSECDVDCDDGDPAAWPGAPEVADDGIDQDCNGFDTITCFVDDDGDDYGTSALLAADGDCLDSGEAPADGDCNDADSGVHPGAPEIADDGIDQDCSGSDAITCFDDGDGDGYGDGALISPDADCSDPGEASVDGDCNDANSGIHPGVPEIADDGIDQDCSGSDSITCFDDGDGDGFGDGTVLSVDADCGDPGESDVDGDCDDGSAASYPGASETANDGIDQDCNGFDTITCFTDGDGDDWGDGSIFVGDGDCSDPGEAALDGDCNDDDDSIFPGAPEIPGDGIDQNCDGVDDGTSCFEDLDGDEFGSTTVIVSVDADCGDPGESALASDCDDGAASVHPGASETADDGIDQDCSGADTVTCFVDDDGDDYGDGTLLAADGDCLDSGEAPVDGDCDDGEDTIYPGATETADDGVDQDCDGSDTVTCFVDADGDGFGGVLTVLAADGDCADPGESDNAADCDDAAASVSPSGSELPDDGVDQDCDGFDTVTCFVDADGDSFGGGSTLLAADGDCADPGESLQSDDCDDSAASVHPSAPELADDGIDQDCNGSDTVTCLEDLDGDTWGSDVLVLAADGECVDPGESSRPGDCDDTLPSVYPGAPEACDATDSDCDGDAVDGFVDTDGDGTLDCVDSDDDADGWDDEDDCGPSDPSTHPDAAELCDNIDSDCDGDLVDDFVDSDTDGVPDCIEGDHDGDGSEGVDDCDDDDPAIYPGAPEVADDGVDQDCDGADTVTCFEDLDGDTIGTATTLLAADGDCLDPGESPVDGDCDDGDIATHPGAPEVADDGIDQDCSGADTVTCFVDADEDGAGSTSNVSAPDGDCDDLGESASDDDCDDSDPARYPGAAELCDAIDSDCDGDLIDGEPDTDGDGEPDCLDIDDDGDLFPDVVDCGPLDPDVFPFAPELCDAVDSDCDASLVDEFDDSDGDGLPDCIDEVGTDDDADGDGFTDDVDCDDGDASVHPGATDLPDDGVDQDCDGVDEHTCFEDADEDGYGATPAGVSVGGVCPGDSVDLGGDCDDDAPLVHPSAAELCNGVDDDCDGGVPASESDDNDGDGWVACLDCDDEDDTVGAGDPEACADALDNDCDGEVDGDDSDCAGLVDADGDGWCEDGVDLDGDGACDGEDEPFTAGEIGDCDEEDPAVSPEAEEACDGIDSDCDPTNQVEEDDGDGDGWSPCDGDCDDRDANSAPDAPEVCADGIDQDCDRTETDAHDDPECWGASCTDCSGSLGSGSGGVLALLLFGLLGRRRVSAPRLAPAAFALLLALPALAQEPGSIEIALTAGDCVLAASLADEAALDAPGDPVLARLQGDARRCLGDARGAVLAYERLLQLEPSSPGIPAVLAGLRTGLAELRVELQTDRAPADPVVRLLVGDQELTAEFAADGAARFTDLSPDVPAVLHLRSPGFAPVEQAVEGLVGGEVRRIELAPTWVGFGRVVLQGADCGCEVFAPGRSEAFGTEPVELTAGPNPLTVVNPQGRVEASVVVARGETVGFDPGPWRPAGLTLVGLPSGASLRVFIEGPEGRSSNREVTLDPEQGALHDQTGVRLASPVTIDSLYGGSGGVFVSHPIVGRGVTAAVLVPGESNTVSFDWSELGGVAAVARQYSLWKDARQTAISTTRPRTVALGIAAAGTGIVAAIFAAAAVGQGRDATELRAQAVSANPAQVDALHGDWQNAMDAEQGLLAGSGVLSAVSLTSAGLTVVFGVQGRRAVAEVGAWEPRPPEEDP